MKRFSIIFHLICALLVWQAQGQSYLNAFSFEGQLKYTVGYKFSVSTSYGRPYSINPYRPRKIPIHIWYPALKENKALIPFTTYIKYETGYKPDSIAVFLRRLIYQYVEQDKISEVVKKLMSLTSNSYYDAIPLKGKFPIILLGNAIDAPGLMYTVLAEFLAANGFVVVAYPSVQEDASINVSYTERELFSQVSDLEFVLSDIAKMPFIDIKKLGLINWSFGGITHMLYQMKYKAARMIISMDGATQYQYGYDLIKRTEFFKDEPDNTPFLDIRAEGPTPFNVPRSNYIYESILTNKQKLVFDNLNHSHMTSVVHLISISDSSNAKLRSQYAEMCINIRDFIIRHLGK